MTTATAPGRPATADAAAKTPREPRKRKPMRSPYPTWFFIPAGVFYVVLFLVPTIASFYFSLTRWTLFDVEFIGFVRPDQRFPDMEALKVQMDKDCARSREILADAARNNPLRGLPLGSD